MKIIITESQFKLLYEEFESSFTSDGTLVGSNPIKDTYWLILSDILSTKYGAKKGGSGINEFLYWGPWVFWKNLDRNGGWPISVGNPPTNRFKYKGGTYAGQPLKNIILIDKGTNKEIELTDVISYGGKKTPQQPPKQVLINNLKLKPELIPLYQEIETVLNDKFTQNHFDQEMAYSGGLKDVATGFSSDAVTSFKNMVKNFGLAGVKIKTNSFRDYVTQKDTFIYYALKKPGHTINGGLRRAALPGFSQHHTGKAFDISSSNLVTDQMLSLYGFKRPYPIDTGFRMPEPWHIYYTK